MEKESKTEVSRLKAEVEDLSREGDAAATATTTLESKVRSLTEKMELLSSDKAAESEGRKKVEKEFDELRLEKERTEQRLVEVEASLEAVSKEFRDYGLGTIRR